MISLRRGVIVLLLLATAGCAVESDRMPPGDASRPDRSGAGGPADGRTPPGRGALDALKGVTAAEIEQRFGSPAFRRKDPPAELWQYRAKTCALDLFLYPQAGQARVGHAAVRGPSGAPVGEAECLAALRRGGGR